MRKKLRILFLISCVVPFIHLACLVGDNSGIKCSTDAECPVGLRCLEKVCLRPGTSIEKEKLTEAKVEASTLDSSLPEEEQVSEEPLDTAECRNGQTRPCDTQEGYCDTGPQKCKEGRWQRCVQGKKASKEVCDGKDNDCDGEIDQTFPDKGKECQVGVGACLEKGIWTCKDDELKCDAVEGQSTKEVCDGVDNDCNGKVDEIPSCKKKSIRAAFSSAATSSKSNKYQLKGQLSLQPLPQGFLMKSPKYHLRGGFKHGRTP